MLNLTTSQAPQSVYLNAPDVIVRVDVHVPAVLYRIWSGRRYKMSANEKQYTELFGIISEKGVSMARCACIQCNSCTCACSCRNIPDFEETESSLNW